MRPRAALFKSRSGCRQASDVPVVPDRLHAGWQGRQFAEVDAGFARAMEVRAARRQEAVALRNPGVFVVLVGRMAAGHDLDGGAAQPPEFLEQGAISQRIELVASGMG